MKGLAALLGGALLLASPLPAQAQPSPAPSLPLPPTPSPRPPGSPPDSAPGSAVGAPAVPPLLAKKDRDLADKRARAAASSSSSSNSGAAPLVTKVGQKPAPIINILHRWTLEVLPISATGPLPPAALQDRLLRDHYTNAAIEMSRPLVPAMVAAAKHFRVFRVDIISGYRHPKYNLILRKKGHEVARDSAHTHGHAVDFRLPGIPTPKLAAWVQSHHKGGVGTYLQSQFVHIDVGPVRRWSGE